MKRMILFLMSTMSSSVLTGCRAESASIGIIGGADGPTAILVSGSFNWVYFFLGGLLAAAVIIAVVKKHRK